MLSATVFTRIGCRCATTWRGVRWKPGESIRPVVWNGREPTQGTGKTGFAMNNKRSYLEAVNAGRQRRPETTLDQLNRSLASLEQQLHQPYERESEPAPRRAAAAWEQGRDERDAGGRDVGGRDPGARDPGGRDFSGSRGEPDQAFKSMVREIETARLKEEGVAAAGRIAGEIKGLREDFSHHDDVQRQIAASLHGEFDALRRDIERAPKLDKELNAEFERLSGAIAALGERGEDKGVTLLRLELEQVKGAIEQLAREDSVRAVATRWDGIEQRLGGFEAKLDAPRRDAAGEAAWRDLDGKLESLGRAVASLPTTRSIQGFEDNLRTLAGVMDQFARENVHLQPETLKAIDRRLDDLSRAVAAAAVPPPNDPRPFERIEARLSAVSRQMEEWRAEAPSDAIMQRLTQLSTRVDELAAKANLPAKAVDQLAHQVAIIADKLDRVGAVSDPDFVFKGIEQRFDTLAAMLERRQGDAEDRAGLLFRDLERRLDEVVDRLDNQAAQDPAAQSRAITAVLDARFDDFARRFETSAAPAADAKLLRGLEEQVKALTEHLSRPAPAAKGVEALTPMLEGLERSFSGSHDRIVAAAREAAENAVRGLAPNTVDKETVAGLVQDLKALEQLARRSDERNGRTFEAIHDTLIKVVDRLGALEPGQFGAGRQEKGNRGAKIAVAEVPSLDLDAPLPIDAPAARRAPAKSDADGRSPAEAASAAALDAISGVTMAEDAPRKRSVLGGLSRALGRGGRLPSAPALSLPATPPEVSPVLDLDEPLDPKIANRPLEPGSGSPDLGAIMRRVRDERAQGPRAPAEADAAKSDFIAAARRAAQAAAAEAEIIKRQADGTAPKRQGRLGAMLRQKTLLMAVGAIMIALAGFQAAKPFFSDRVPEMASETAESRAAEPRTAETQTAETQTAETQTAETQAGETQAGETQAEPAAVAQAAVVPAAAVPAGDSESAAPPADLEASADAAEEDTRVPAGDMPETAMAAPAPGDTASVAASAAGMADDASAVAGPAPAEGMGVPAAVEPAALRDAANGGDAKALWEVGTRFAEGKSVPADPAAAARWFEAAADLGLAPAQYRIGSLYEKGTGVARDLAKAKTWYAKAANAGNASAMHNLAVLDAMGADGTTDNEAAALWFSQAAEHGVKDSQFNLGILAAKGVGMAQNLEESYKWFALVAMTGDKDAAGKRDEIAKALSPEALKRARATVELWKAKPLDPEANTVEIPDSWQNRADSTASVDMKAAVRTIQLILAKNGYEAGGTDGVMGARTKAAIIAFQKDNRLPPSGEVDDKLVKALLALK